MSDVDKELFGDERAKSLLRHAIEKCETDSGQLEFLRYVICRFSVVANAAAIADCVRNLIKMGDDSDKRRAEKN